jgi:hypothetical protein
LLLLLLLQALSVLHLLCCDGCCTHNMLPKLADGTSCCLPHHACSTPVQCHEAGQRIMRLHNAEGQVLVCCKTT